MNRVTRKSLEIRIRRIVAITKTPLTLHSQSQMPGRRYRIESDDESRNHSGLLTPREMECWLEGYEKSLEMLRCEAHDEVGHRQRNLEWQLKQRGMDTRDEAQSIGNVCSAPVIGCLFCPCPACRNTAAEREHARKRTMKGFLPVL